MSCIGAVCARDQLRLLATEYRMRSDDMLRKADEAERVADALDEGFGRQRSLMRSFICRRATEGNE